MLLSVICHGNSADTVFLCVSKLRSEISIDAICFPTNIDRYFSKVASLYNERFTSKCFVMRTWRTTSLRLVLRKRNAQDTCVHSEMFKSHASFLRLKTLHSLLQRTPSRGLKLVLGNRKNFSRIILRSSRSFGLLPAREIVLLV